MLVTVFTVRVGEYNFSVIITIINNNNNNIREIIYQGRCSNRAFAERAQVRADHSDFHVNDVFLQLEDATLFRAPLLIAA